VSSVPTGRFGYPIEQVGLLTELTLDLRAAGTGLVGYVSAVDPKPALYVLGPFPEDVDPEDTTAWDTVPQTNPLARSWSGGLVSFTFAESFSQGNYRVVVVPSRIDMVDAVGTRLGAPDLRDRQGVVWTGWTLTVIEDPRTPNTAEVLGEETAPDVVVPVGANVAPAPASETALRLPQATVLIDNRVVEAGVSELSGEMIEVRAPAGSDVRFVVEPLIAGSRETLYDRYRVETEVVNDATGMTLRIGSAGLVDNYLTAVYRGHDTVGRLPTGADGRLLYGVPVVRTPVPAAVDPLVVPLVEEVTDPATSNRYAVVTYAVTPESAPLDATGATDDDWAYGSRPVVYPIELVDATDTPATNPRALGRMSLTGALYLNEPVGYEITDQTKVGVFDFPLCSRLRVYVDGVQVWWGQTRLLPVVVRPERWTVSGGPGLVSAAARADALVQLWQASSQALRRWRCVFPGSGSLRPVPESMEAFVLTYLLVETDGGLLTDGTQGKVSVQVGDNTFSGQSDYALRRRLSALEDLLAACVPETPLFPEDDLPSTSAYAGSLASPSHYPAATYHDVTAPYAPTNPSSGNPHDAMATRTGLRRRDLFDPSNMRRL
jgi:hypothetical protein